VRWDEGIGARAHLVADRRGVRCEGNWGVLLLVRMVSVCSSVECAVGSVRDSLIWS